MGPGVLAFEEASAASWVVFRELFYASLERSPRRSGIILNQTQRRGCLIIASPHLVFCSLSFPGILMMLFRISLPILNLCISDDLIPNNVLDTNSPTFFQNTGFIGI